MEIRVGVMRSPVPGDRDVEVVERKGRGHPDTICDALAEQVSRALCEAYWERFGRILHHNVDKVLLRGGVARTAFGGGAVLEPIDVYLAGRATIESAGGTSRVDEIAARSAERWLRSNLRMLDADRHVRIHSLIRPGSTELVDLFQRSPGGQVPLANDTSIGVGFAPETVLERTVRAVERHLNSPDVHRDYPWVGEDVKVLGIRSGDRVGLTVACAFIDHEVRSVSDYAEKKAVLHRIVAERASRLIGAPCNVTLNGADNVDAGDVYLTVTGTSAEAGDDGEAGRGNRANGLITPYRPMSMEAAAGKNPVTHVGKLYQIAARRLAEAIVETVDGVEGAECYLVSQIGQPVDEPQLVDVHVQCSKVTGVEAEVGRIVREEVRRVPLLWQEALELGLEVF